jgi:hypothetical protein
LYPIPAKSLVIFTACARDSLLIDHPHLPKGWTIAEDGFPPSLMGADGVPRPAIRVFCRRSHGSINKAAAITGIGRRNVVELESSGEDQLKVGMDVDDLEETLKAAQSDGVGRIVLVGLGEVNTVSESTRPMI